MHIGFFGHSMCVKYPENIVTSWTDHIINHFSPSKVTHHGYIQCSEERILYNLKRTQKINLCIIFHSYPKYYFIPSMTRDIAYTEDNEILKIKFDEYFFENSKIDRNEFLKSLETYNKFYYNKENNLNRYYGALIQIDQFLLRKKIPVVHCLTSDSTCYPDWFTFKSGICDTEISKIQITHREPNHLISGNNVTKKGNKIIFKKLLPLIEMAFKKVGKKL